MSAEAVQKLEPIDLLRIYGNIDYEWALRTDVIQWQGSLLSLVVPDFSFNMGSGFCNLFNQENFRRRMEGLAKADPTSGKYSITYDLSLPSCYRTPIHEEGRLILGVDGKPYALQGHIRFLDEENRSLSKDSGYDLLTGYQGKEVLYEALAGQLTKSLQTEIPAAYMAVSIDQLCYLNAAYGPVILFKLIKAVADRLKITIRFNDMIGRTSAACLGIILQECDQWGIIRAAQRLAESVESEPFSIDGQEIPAHISLGGIVFPDADLTAEHVMKQAERGLLERQMTKGLGKIWTPYDQPMKTERRNDAPVGRRRSYDD